MRALFTAVALFTLSAASPPFAPVREPTPATTISNIPMYTAPVSSQSPAQTGYLEWKKEKLANNRTEEQSDVVGVKKDTVNQEKRFNYDSGKTFYGQGMMSEGIDAPGVQAWPAYRGFPIGGIGPYQDNYISAALYQGLFKPGLVPDGVNPVNCVPKEGELPIILIPGTFESAYLNWAYMGPKLVAEGFCVYTFNHNPIQFFEQPLFSVQVTSFMGDIVESAQALDAFVDEVLDITGAEKVDLVGHSQGAGALPYYYLKFLMDGIKVRKHIGIAPSLGTDLAHIDTLFDFFCRDIWEIGASELVSLGFNSAALDQQLEGSDFMATLKEGGSSTIEGVEYVNIATVYENVLIPYTNCLPAEEDGKNITNIVLQDVCPEDGSDHPNVAYSQNVYNMVLNHLRNTDNPFTCVKGYALLPVLPDWEV